MLLICGAWNIVEWAMTSVIDQLHDIHRLGQPVDHSDDTTMHL